ncbi:MAG: MBL fold metallo-hydrolase, partial [Acidimicrobiales bacterium]
MDGSPIDNAANEAKAPSEFTEQANAAARISFDDPGDFGRAQRGLLATIEDGRVVIPNGPGGGEHVVWDVANHAFVTEREANPSSVHPGLWRQARLNVNHGLFEVAEGVWQVRGYDVANITFMAGSDGWLIIDPLTNAPAAAAALDLANRTLGERPVTSI